MYCSPSLVVRRSQSRSFAQEFHVGMVQGMHRARQPLPPCNLAKKIGLFDFVRREVSDSEWRIWRVPTPGTPEASCLRHLDLQWNPLHALLLALFMVVGIIPPIN